MKVFTRTEAAKLRRVPPKKLESWVARGIVKPRGAGRGGGHPYYFTFPEVVRAAIIHAAQEYLGTHVRPRLLSKALHEELSDLSINEVRAKIEPLIKEGATAEARRRAQRVLDEAVLVLFRDVGERDDGTEYRRDKWSVEENRSWEEEGPALPSSGPVLSLRVEYGHLIHILLFRMDLMRRKITAMKQAAARP